MWLHLAVALAEPDTAPSAARLCAEAAAGTEVEVCLKLATTRPDEVDEVAAALRSHIDRASTADRELMFALLLLLSEDTAVKGTEALGALEDPRAIPPLVHAVETRSPAVALAAVDALAVYPGGITHLSRWLLDRDRSIEVRVRCAEALGRTGRVEAADALIDSLRRRGLPPVLREAMLAAIRTHHPDRVDELVTQISRDGTPWITVSGTVSLGYAMAVAGRFSQPEIAGIGALAGTIAGGTVSYLAAQAFPTEAEDAAFITVNGILGTGAGVALGAGVLRGNPDAAGWAGLGGEVGGLALGLAFHRIHQGSVNDSLEAALMGVATAAVFGGALDIGVKNGLSDPEGQGTNPPFVGAGIGLIAGTTFGHLIAPGLRFEGNDWALVTLATATGAAIGTFAPLAGNERGALPAVGAAAGTLAGIALAGTVDPDWDALGSGAMGALYGGLIVGGAADWAFEDPQITGGGALAGGLVGMGLGSLLADLDQDPIDDRDVVLMLYTTGWTAAITAGVQELRNGDPFAQLGPLLVLPAASGAIVSGLSPVLDVPVTHSSAAVSLGLMAGYVGGSAGELLVDDPVAGAIVGGNAGLLLGSVLVSPFIGVPPTTVALADAGGILGGASGIVIARGFDDEPDALLLGGVVGAGVGFAGGALVGHALRRSGATRNIALSMPRLPDTARVAVVPGVVQGAEGPAWGATIQVFGW
ncbi:MAG: hypothetical protein H6737_29165 [Alphaproteobacteria bacterium]|nr:hypothetical protein [Alphaproteobacteria bacterium]